MRAILLASIAIASGALLLSACSAEESHTQCTSAPQSEWMDQAEFQQGLEEQGYKINEFKVTEGQCYEIYGFNADDQKVEIYFNPVDGSIVKQEME